MIAQLYVCMYVRILYQYFMIKSLFCECSVQKIKTHLYKNSAKKFCYKNGCIAHGNKTFLHLLDASPLWACQREVYQTLKHFHYSYKSFVGTSFWEHVCKRHLCCPHLLVARDLGCMQIWWHGYTAGYYQQRDGHILSEGDRVKRFLRKSYRLAG